MWVLQMHPTGARGRGNWNLKSRCNTRVEARGGSNHGTKYLLCVIQMSLSMSTTKSMVGNAICVFNLIRRGRGGERDWTDF